MDKHQTFTSEFFNWFGAMALMVVVLAVPACNKNGASNTDSQFNNANTPVTVQQAEPVSKKRKITKIGVQLYTLRHELAQDFEGTLRKVAKLGFDEVEFAGLYNRDPREVRALLQSLNLEGVASHVNWARFKEDPDALIEETVALGADYMILAWMPEEERQTIAQWQDWIARFNDAGKKAKARGINFAFHNHEFEFIEIDGVKPYDLILEGINRDDVKLELDLYWITLAGDDPKTYLAQFENGFPLAHVKDMTFSDKKMADVGSGDIDFPAIFAAAQTAGLRHYIVEHDNTADPFQSIENSLTYLRALDY